MNLARDRFRRLIREWSAKYNWFHENFKQQRFRPPLPFSRKGLSTKRKLRSNFQQKSDHRTLGSFWGRNSLWGGYVAVTPPDVLWCILREVAAQKEHKTLMSTRVENSNGGGGGERQRLCSQSSQHCKQNTTCYWVLFLQLGFRINCSIIRSRLACPILIGVICYHRKPLPRWRKTVQLHLKQTQNKSIDAWVPCIMLLVRQLKYKYDYILSTFAKDYWFKPH